MEAVPSDVFPYVYSFLIQNKFKKTAKCFEKELGSVRCWDLNKRSLLGEDSTICCLSVLDRVLIFL